MNLAMLFLKSNSTTMRMIDTPLPTCAASCINKPEEPKRVCPAQHIIQEIFCKSIIKHIYYLLSARCPLSIASLHINHTFSMDSPRRRLACSPPTMASMASDPNPSVVIDIGFMSNEEFATLYNDETPPTLDKVPCSLDQMERQQTSRHVVEDEEDDDSSPKRCCSPWF